MNHRPLTHEYVEFLERTDRPRYIGRRFAKYLEGRVLDVGCDRAALREVVGPERYGGVGLGADADFRVDLENDGRLPFDDGAWDTVVCLDVLEHLNDLHGMFDECLRVAGRYAVISLPNNWSTARKRIARGHGSFIHYGLPLDPPEDRHKWFFNTEEARDFLLGMAERKGLVVHELVVLEKPRPIWNRAWRRLWHPTTRSYSNLYPHTLVCVYGRT